MVAGLWAGLRPAESRAGAGASARRGWEKWRGIVAAGDPGPGPGRRGVATVPAQPCRARCRDHAAAAARSEEHTSELQSLMRISYAVFCLKKKNITHTTI